HAQQRMRAVPAALPNKNIRIINPQPRAHGNAPGLDFAPKPPRHNIQRLAPHAVNPGPQQRVAQNTRNTHTSAEIPQPPKNSKYFLAAYHKACIQCHRSLLKQRDRLEKSGVLDDNILPEYGPVACVECHFEN
ncbi:MAG: cytochrome c family protein, partial [Proteobacteria bacterium]|nr:cytochrome c family protein [Pseudomonadota bacterium]